MKTTIQLTPEKFAEIYTDERLRNNVAFAHGYCDAGGRELGKKTCSYPVDYYVTPEQIQEANKERERAKQEVIKDNAGKLMFVGMGCTYEPRYDDDVCNHRIRCEFVNTEGHRYFIEVGTGNGHAMRIDHSIDRDLEILHEIKLQEYFSKREQFERYSKEWHEVQEQIEYWRRQLYNNFAGLQRMTDPPKFTKQNVLALVNHFFNCDFKEIVIDNYNVTTDDFTNVSPKMRATT